jgi:membrane protease YdiL (CAAX protease family)
VPPGVSSSYDDREGAMRTAGTTVGLSGSVVVAEPSPRRTGRVWRALAGIEVIAVVVTVALDLLVPTLIILALAFASLGVRREGFSSFGFRRVARPWKLVGTVFLFAAGWSVVQLAVVMPIANHVSGKKQDLSDFAGLQGNVGMLLGLLVLSWTLAALGEELAYRGYLQTRIVDLFGPGTTGVVIAVLLSSLLFGVAHSEQGAVGVVATALDAVVFSVLRYRYKTLWAAVLAHGFNNTIGFLAFFLVGPLHGLW